MGVSVLVAERVPHTLSSWSTALLASPPDHGAVRLLADVMVAFFRMVVVVAGDLEYALPDFHWDNIGFTVDHAVVLVDCEGMYHAPTARPRDKYGSGALTQALPIGLRAHAGADFVHVQVR